MISAVYLLPCFFAALTLGHWLGERAIRHSLTIGPDEKGVTGAHCIDGKFYYLVPESKWARVAHWCPAERRS